MRTVQAFTLPELLLTAALLAYSLSVILVTFSSSVTLNEASRNLTTATTHAEHILETIRSQTFSRIGTNIAGGVWNWTTAQVTGQGLSALKNESTQVTSSGSTLLNVQVTISWQEHNGRNRSRTLQTSITG